MEIIFGFILAFILIVFSLVVLFRGVSQRIEGRNIEMKDEITKLENRVKELENKEK